MAAQAVLAPGVPLLHGPWSALDVAGQTVLLELDAVVGEIARHRGVVIARGGQQGDKNDDGQRQADDHEVGFFQAKSQYKPAWCLVAFGAQPCLTGAA